MSYLHRASHVARHPQALRSLRSALRSSAAVASAPLQLQPQRSAHPTLTNSSACIIQCASPVSFAPLALSVAASAPSTASLPMSFPQTQTQPLLGAAHQMHVMNSSLLTQLFQTDVDDDT